MIDCPVGIASRKIISAQKRPADATENTGKTLTNYRSTLVTRSTIIVLCRATVSRVLPRIILLSLKYTSDGANQLIDTIYGLIRGKFTENITRTLKRILLHVVYTSTINRFSNLSTA